MYDPYNDPELERTVGIIFFCFILLLFGAFLVLKIAAIITWSWWWVVAPIWIPVVFGVICNIFNIKPPGR